MFCASLRAGPLSWTAFGGTGTVGVVTAEAGVGDPAAVFGATLDDSNGTGACSASNASYIASAGRAITGCSDSAGTTGNSTNW